MGQLLLLITRIGPCKMCKDGLRNISNCLNIKILLVSEYHVKEKMKRKFSQKKFSFFSNLFFLLIYSTFIESLGIDGSLLDHINDADLQSDFGISVRLHRVKILEGIKKLQVQASTVT